VIIDRFELCSSAIKASAELITRAEALRQSLDTILTATDRLQSAAGKSKGELERIHRRVTDVLITLREKEVGSLGIEARRTLHATWHEMD